MSKADPSYCPPPLRALPSERVVHQNVDGIAFHDPLGIAEPSFVPREFLPVLIRLDGMQSVEADGVDTTSSIVSSHTLTSDSCFTLSATNVPATRFWRSGLRPAFARRRMPGRLAIPPTLLVCAANSNGRCLCAGPAPH